MPEKPTPIVASFVAMLQELERLPSAERMKVGEQIAAEFGNAGRLSHFALHINTYCSSCEMKAGSVSLTIDASRPDMDDDIPY